MVPLQIACCADCRKRHLTASYLKIVFVLAVMGLSLLLLTLTPIAPALRKIHESVPFLVFLALLPISWLVGNVLTNRYIAKNSGVTRFDIQEIPFVRELLDAGWFPLYENTNGCVSRLAFSKSRLTQGWFI